MAETVTGLEVLDLLLLKRGIGQKIANGQIGSIGATSIVSVFHFAHTERPTNYLRNLGAGGWRPGNATGIADDWRPFQDLAESTGTVTIDTVSDTTLGTEDIYQIEHGIHPQWIIDALNAARYDVFFQNMEPLSAKPTLSTVGDHGFQSTATTAYTESDADGGAATTFTKITTADHARIWGASIASGRVVNAAANGYIRQRFYVEQGEQVYVAAIGRKLDSSSTGPSLTLYDNTNSAEIGTAVTHGERQWQYMWRKEPVPSTCEVLELRLQGVGASDDILWGAKWVYRENDLRFALDSTWDMRKQPKLVYGRFHGNSVAAGVTNAMALNFEDIPEEDYSFDMQRAGANPRWVQFHTDRWLNGPIWISGLRAHADVDGPFTRVLTETTSCDLELFEAAAARRLFMDERVQVPNKAARLARAEADKLSFGTTSASGRPSMRTSPYYYAGLRS